MPFNSSTCRQRWPKAQDMTKLFLENSLGIENENLNCCFQHPGKCLITYCEKTGNSLIYFEFEANFWRMNFWFAEILFLKYSNKNLFIFFCILFFLYL